MDRADFVRLSEAYGGDLNKWPLDTRDAARNLAAADETAATILAEAAVLDELLSSAEPTSPSDLLLQRILAARPRPAFDADWRRPAVAAALALVVGLASGFAGGLVTPGVSGDDYVTPEYADAFDGLVEDWSAWDWSDV